MGGKPRPLGSVQLSVLCCLIRMGGRWSLNRHGWVWANDSGTDRILQSLAKRGLVDIGNIETSSRHGVVHHTNTEYAASDLGRATHEAYHPDCRL